MSKRIVEWYIVLFCDMELKGYMILINEYSICMSKMMSLEYWNIINGFC